MTIRTATTADLPALAVMGRRFREASVYRGYLGDLSDETLLALGARLLGGAGTILVLEVEGQVVGMIGLFCGPHFFSGERFAGEVFWWVQEDQRGTAGLKLWRAAEAWAKAQGAVTLQMIAPDERVEALYQRRGYVPLERTYYRRLDAA